MFVFSTAFWTLGTWLWRVLKGVRLAEKPEASIILGCFSLNCEKEACLLYLQLCFFLLGMYLCARYTEVDYEVDCIGVSSRLGNPIEERQQKGTPCI